MKKIVYFCLLTSLTLMTQCKTSTSPVAGIDLTDMDLTIKPSEDFYQFANAGWMKKTPLPAEYARFGTFDQLADSTQSQLLALVDTLQAKEQAQGSVGQKIKDLYLSALDTASLNQLGVTPILEELSTIDRLVDLTDFQQYWPTLFAVGIDPFVSFYVGADDMNADWNLPQLMQGGISMGDRDYYIKDDAHCQELRTAYVAHMIRMFEIAGLAQEEATVAAQDVMTIETLLAAAQTSREDLRDPYLNYHKLTLAQLQDTIPAMDWDLFFTQLGATGISEINVGQIPFTKEMSRVITSQPLSALKNYLKWNVLNASANFLSEDIALEHFDFFGKTLSGREMIQPRWKRAISTINGALGEGIGQLYVEQYFPAEAKARMLDLVHNLQISLGERIEQLTWMSDTTKALALEKLSTFHVKIGYPDKWKDYTSLTITPDSYWENIKKVSHFSFQESIDKIGKKVDKEEWFMTPQTVNAYYNPTTNEICFPAGILQPPFFNMQADDAVNYGAIGVVIGHEMTHGFDDQGSQYDKNGNLKQWWTAQDAAQFKARTNVLKDYFSKIEVAPGTFANGAYTLGENIADHGGLQVAFNAFRKSPGFKSDQLIDGFTPQQRFFIAFAHVWANNIREQEVLRRTAEDSHSLGEWRVNGSLPHISAFAEAFQLKEGDRMYLPEAERASIW